MLFILSRIVGVVSMIVVVSMICLSCRNWNAVHAWSMAGTTKRFVMANTSKRWLSSTSSALNAKKKIKVDSVEIISDTVEELAPAVSRSPKKEPEPIRFYCNPPPDNLNNAVSNATHVVFTVYGEPMALARHRASKFGIMYNPCAKFQKQFLVACTPFLPSVPYPGPIEATVKFYLQRPKNHYGSGKNSHILKKDAPHWPAKRLGR